MATAERNPKTGRFIARKTQKVNKTVSFRTRDGKTVKFRAVSSKLADNKGNNRSASKQ